MPGWGGSLDPSELLPELTGDIHMHLEVSDSSRCPPECSVVSCLAVLGMDARILEAEQGKGRQSFSLTDVFFFLFRTTPAAHGNSLGRGQNGHAAAGLHHSHSNVRCLTY